jgi:hypothetical protein
VGHTQSAFHSAQPSAISKKSTEFASHGWAKDERILSEAVSLRADKLQSRTGVRFDKNWIAKVSLEWGLGRGIDEFDGLYRADTQTMYFPIHIVYDLKARHKPSPGALNAHTVAQDDELGELLDHELGHELMDQVSRRNGLGPWFTEQRFDSSTNEEKLGLDIVSEGTAVFFQTANYPRDYKDLSERSFPATRAEQAFYTYKVLTCDGGYWLVRDILSRYGERGLVWLMRHPFIASDNMRQAAVVYRQRALGELSAR